MKNIIHIFSLMVLLVSCSNGDKDINQNILMQLELNSFKFVDLREVVPVPWQTFCAIGPYVSNEYVENLIGFKWNVKRYSSISSNDGITLLLFINENKVIAYAEYPRSKGDFLELKPQCLNREKATLKVKRENEGGLQFIYSP